MNNIFQVDDFSASETYQKNDAVSQGGFFRYALNDVAAGAFTEAEWGGKADDPIDGAARPHFFWVPSYGASVNNEPVVNTIKFGDGYQQRVADGINNNLLKIEYSFDNRDNAEAFAILHFLHSRSGTEMFLFKPHAPYRKLKRFVCKTWVQTYNFYDNNTIRARFEEVVI